MDLITTRLFPLPNVVFFPKTHLSLHIFEPRYRQLMRDALAGDRRIAIGLLQPGWERDYYGNPPVYEVCCVGAIESFEELADGKFNLLLVGEQKIRIQKIFHETPYRTIGGVLLQDHTPRKGAGEIRQQQEQILELAMEYCRLRSGNEPDFTALKELEFEALINSLAAHLGLPAWHKQQLLELDDLEQRARQVARFLQSQVHEESILKKFQHLSPRDPNRN